MVGYTYNPSALTWEAEGGGLKILAHLGLHSVYQSYKLLMMSSFYFMQPLFAELLTPEKACFHISAYLRQEF